MNLNHLQHGRHKQEHLYVPLDKRIFEWLAKDMINTTDFVLYAYLVRRTSPDDFGSVAFPSNKTIQEDTGIGRSSIQDGLKNLERCRIITIQRKSLKSKKRSILVNLRLRIKKQDGRPSAVEKSSVIKMPSLTRKEWFFQQKQEAAAEKLMRAANQKSPSFSFKPSPRINWDDDDPAF